MDTQSVIVETLIMMGFTFVIGFAVAFLIKLMIACVRFFEKRQAR
jgi:hypothetical protein